jgi:hypothetical protein
MQKDEEVGKVAQATPVVICKSFSYASFKIGFIYLMLLPSLTLTHAGWYYL